MIFGGGAKEREAEGADREVVVINGDAEFGAVEVVITFRPRKALLLVLGERGKFWFDDLGFFLR